MPAAAVARLMAATVQYEGGFDAFPWLVFLSLRILLYVQNRIIGGALLVSERKIQTVRFALHLMGHIFHDALKPERPDILAGQTSVGRGVEGEQPSQRVTGEARQAGAPGRSASASGIISSRSSFR